MTYQLTTPDPVSGRPRLRATEYWRSDAIEVAEKIADERGVPVTVQQIRTRGGIPKLVKVVKPTRPTTP